MNTLKLNAYAKINLTLDVLGLRDDGYHEVSMIMQSVNLYDEIKFTESDSFNLSCDNIELPIDKNNLIFKAMDLIKTRFNISSSVNINLKKSIPIAAGLAGGSADAATTLLALNILWKLNLPIGKLVNLGAELGSDIPFCLIGGTALAKGRGEKITVLNSLPKIWLVLVKPNFGVSTKEIYAEWDKEYFKKELIFKSTNKLLAEINKLGIDDWSNYITYFDNNLEKVTSNLYPEISYIKNIMLENNCMKAVMSGSGPTVYGIMRNREDAKQLADNLRKIYNQVYITQFI